MPIITIGMGLAKHIFAVYGVNKSAYAELVKPKFITPCRMFGRCGKNNARLPDRMRAIVSRHANNITKAEGSYLCSLLVMGCVCHTQ